jgi:hypothetical protein
MGIASWVFGVVCLFIEGRWFSISWLDGWMVQRTKGQYLEQ